MSKLDEILADGKDEVRSDIKDAVKALFGELNYKVGLPIPAEGSSKAFCAGAAYWQHRLEQQIKKL